jgi:hypothetical protein
MQMTLSDTVKCQKRLSSLEDIYFSLSTSSRVNFTAFEMRLTNNCSDFGLDRFYGWILYNLNVSFRNARLFIKEDIIKES